MRTMYYFQQHHSTDRDEIEQRIALYEYYVSEEELMRLLEHEIYIVDCLEDLQQYCIEFGYEYETLKEAYNE